MSEVREKFESAGQGQVFRFYGDLSPEEQQNLLRQAEKIDLDEIEELTETLLRNPAEEQSFEDMQPAPYIPLPRKGGDAEQWERARNAGEEALKSGRVAAFTVAGGQGTRLGFDGPKGTFPVTPVTQKTLFQVFAEKILAAQKRYGKPIPWFIMTSDINHDDTVSFFEKNNFFGLDSDRVTFFSQGLMPAVDHDGKIMLADRSNIALSPDGHGGSLRALVRNGCTDTLKEAGIDIVSYFQVDNPLVSCVDPAFIGFHLLNDSQLSSKACEKAYPEEKVGVFCMRDTHACVVEYSDLPRMLSEEVDEEGHLRYRGGSIAIHIFSRDLIERLGRGDDPEARLPFHRADKKVPTVDDTGEPVEPTEPNGIKFEMFVFDALPFATNPVIIETAREEEFSPVKNADGKDSPETARKDQLRQWARWVRAAGVDVPVNDDGVPEFEFEISPLFADSEEALIERRSELPEIKDGTVIE